MKLCTLTNNTIKSLFLNEFIVTIFRHSISLPTYITFDYECTVSIHSSCCYCSLQTLAGSTELRRPKTHLQSAVDLLRQQLGRIQLRTKPNEMFFVFLLRFFLVGSSEARSCCNCLFIHRRIVVWPVDQHASQRTDLSTNMSTNILIDHRFKHNQLACQRVDRATDQQVTNIPIDHRIKQQTRQTRKSADWSIVKQLIDWKKSIDQPINI